MKNRMLSAITVISISLFLTGCQTGLKPPQNPKVVEIEIEQLPSIKFSGEGKYKAAFDNRKTYNLFRPWNSWRGTSDYGLFWSGYTSRPDKIGLQEIYWNYYYTRKVPYPGLEPFIRKGVNWNHDAEYGETFAVKYYDPEYANWFANFVKTRANAADGVMLDWWHDHHGKHIASEQTVRNARIEIAKAIKKINGSDYLILGNVNWRKEVATLPWLNGVFLELYKTPYKRANAYYLSEIDKMVDLIKYYDSNLQYPKLIAFEPWRVTDKSKSAQIDRLSADNQRYAQLFANILNIHSDNGYFIYADNNHDSAGGDHAHALYDFYKLDIGKPVSVGNSPISRVGFRAYEKGLMGYNYTENLLIINYDGFVLNIPPFSGNLCVYKATDFISKCE